MWLRCSRGFGGLLLLPILMVGGFSGIGAATENLAHFRLKEPLSREIMENFIQMPPSRDEFAELLQQGEYSKKLYEISCYAAEHHPKQAAKIFSAFWGGSLDGMVPICTEWLLEAKVPESKPMVKLYQKLSGIDTFNGTLRYSMRKNGWNLEVQAATIPVYGEKAISDGQNNVEAYLQKWASQGIWEKKQLTQLREMQKEALPAMQAYYQKQFRLTPEQAEQCASYYISVLQGYYLGRFSE